MILYCLLSLALSSKGGEGILRLRGFAALRFAIRNSFVIRHLSFVIRHFEFKSSSADPSILSRLPPSPFYWPGFYRWDLRLRA